MIYSFGLFLVQVENSCNGKGESTGYEAEQEHMPGHQLVSEAAGRGAEAGSCHSPTSNQAAKQWPLDFAHHDITSSQTQYAAPGITKGATKS